MAINQNQKVELQDFKPNYFFHIIKISHLTFYILIIIELISVMNLYIARLFLLNAL